MKFIFFVLIFIATMTLPIFIKKSAQVSIVIYALYSLITTTFSIHSNAVQKEEEYQRTILGLKNQKKDFENKLSEVNSAEFVEKEARTRLNMRKDGEEVYLISSNEAKKSLEVTYTETTPKGSKNTSNFQKWMEILF